MPISGLLDNQMVTEGVAAGAGFPLNSGQSHGSGGLCMTKLAATTRYNLAANFGSYLNNQLVPAGPWAVGGDVTLPTGARATVDTNSIRTTTATLIWFDFADNVGVVGFRIEYFNGSVWVLVANVGLVTTYNLTGMAPNVSVQYGVKAKDAAGNVSTTGGTVGWTSAINPPTSVTASGPTSNTVNLSWVKSNGPWTTANTDATSQHIYVNGVLYVTISGTVSSYQVTGLSGSTSYSFMVLASGSNNNSGAISDNSNTANATTTAADTTPPTTPFLNAIGDFGGGFLRLTWSASTDASGIAYYDVYREENNSGIFAVIGQTTATTFDDINVFDANGYAYKIKAIDNASIPSAFSNTQTIFYSTGGGGAPIGPV
jgi:hypothetical protein